jgi:hypothetical protein
MIPRHTFQRRITALTALIILAAVIWPGQAKWVPPETAKSARRHVRPGTTIRRYCAPRGDRMWTAVTVKKAAVRSVYGQYAELLVNGRAEDLAYLYVRHQGRWRNLARLLDIRTFDVPDRVGETSLLTAAQKRKKQKKKRRARYRMGPYKPPAGVNLSAVGQRALNAARQLAFVEKKIINGSCWKFANMAYMKAGFNFNKRHYVWRGPKGGPYAPVSRLRPGDWVYHLNQEYGGIEHSSIFVRWVNRGKKLAKTIDYSGMNRAEPGHYSNHRYTKIFAIIRGGR